MLAVILLNMTAGFQWNIIFPFIPFMVEELRGTTVNTGAYVGVLAASYSAGQFLASFIWPPLSDSLGRKKMLILGQFGLLLPFVFFVSHRSRKIFVLLTLLVATLKPVSRAGGGAELRSCADGTDAQRPAAAELRSVTGLIPINPNN
eukprot:SAG31_NODE_2561_length_5481_cov_2.689335_2_plen_147_part_00